MTSQEDRRCGPGWLICLGLWVLMGGAAAAAEAPVSDATQECLDCHGGVPSRHRGGLAGQPPRTNDPGPGHGRRGPGRQGLQLRRARIPARNGRGVRRMPYPARRSPTGTASITTGPTSTWWSVRTTAPPAMSPSEANTPTTSWPMPAKTSPTTISTQTFSATSSASPAPGPGALTFAPADAATRADACIYCHGTEVTVTGTEVRDTDAGELEFPVLDGWPNQGVGRINPDGSAGACSACHTRHAFSLEMARKTLHLQGVPRGAGRAGLQGLRGQQARQPFLGRGQGLEFQGRSLDRGAGLYPPPPAPPATSVFSPMPTAPWWPGGPMP